MRDTLKSVFASAARVANHTPLNPDGLPRYARSDGVLACHGELVWKTIQRVLPDFQIQHLQSA